MPPEDAMPLNLADLIPDADALTALEPEELGLQLLHVLDFLAAAL